MTQAKQETEDQRESSGDRAAGRARPGIVTIAAAAGIYLVAVGLTALPAGQEADGTTSVQSGVYTKAQANRGKQVFDGVCGACHLPDEFAGPIFMNGWTGQSAHGLFELIRLTMPEDNPGGLRRNEYVDVLAYIFEMNGMPAGKTELEGSDEALKKVIIEGPYKPSAGGAAP